jgi:hypothetical protein
MSSGRITGSTVCRNSRRDISFIPMLSNHHLAVVASPRLIASGVEKSREGVSWGEVPATGREDRSGRKRSGALDRESRSGPI